MLDLGNRYVQQLHEMVTKIFPTRFNREPDNFLTFVEHVLERKIKAGWDRTALSIMDISMGPPMAPNVYNVVE